MEESLRMSTTFFTLNMKKMIWCVSSFIQMYFSHNNCFLDYQNIKSFFRFGNETSFFWFNVSCVNTMRIDPKSLSACFSNWERLRLESRELSHGHLLLSTQHPCQSNFVLEVCVAELAEYGSWRSSWLNRQLQRQLLHTVYCQNQSSPKGQYRLNLGSYRSVLYIMSALFLMPSSF